MKLFSLLLLAFSLIFHGSALSHDHQALSFRNHFQPAHRANAHRLELQRLRDTTRRKPSNPNPSLPNTQARAAAKSSKPGVTGVLNVASKCGDIGATKSVTASSGPNGNENWLNCGINDGGWRPPHVTVDDLITEDLSSALKTSNSPFGACKPYVQYFIQYGQENGIPSILLAAIALQESSCNPDASGGAGEQGLMQITHDKCNGAPSGNCKDPEYNIRTGAKFFADTLAANGGNIIETIGMYNGWKSGMTYVEATAAGSGPCCRCQNNLDYIHQTVNGWLQNINVYGNNPRLGVYFNLDKCGN